MASDVLAFQLRLIDQWSKPAKAVSLATKELTQTVKDLTNALRQVQTVKLPVVPKSPSAPKKIDPRATGEMQMPGAVRVDTQEAAIAQRVSKDEERAAAAMAKRAEAALKVKHLAEASEAANRLGRFDDSSPTQIKMGEREVQKYRKMLSEAKLALDGLQTSQRQLNLGAVVDLDAMRRVSAEIQRTKNRISEIQRVLIMTGNASRFGREGTNRLVTTLRELAEAAGGRFGVFAGRVGAIQQFGSAAATAGKEIAGLSLAGKASVAAIVGVGVAATAAVAGVVALGAAAVVTGAALAKLTLQGAAFAIKATESSQHTTAMLEALLGSARAAKVTSVDIENLTRDYATTPDRLKEIANQLGTMGMRGTKMMRESLTMITQTETILGGAAANKLQGILEEAAKPRFWGVAAGSSEGVQRMALNAQMLEGTGIRIQEVWAEMSKRTGQSMEEIRQRMMMGLAIPSQMGIEVLGAVVEKKFGVSARRLANTFTAQLERFKTGIKRLFSDVDTSPLGESLKQIVRLFDTTTYTGTAFKFLIEKIYGGFFNIASQAIPWLRVALKGLAIVGLEVYVGLRPMLHHFGLIDARAKEGSGSLEKFMDITIGFGKAAGKAAELTGDFIVKIDQLLERMGGLKTAMRIGTGMLSPMVGGGNLVKFSVSAAQAGKETADGLAQGIRSRTPHLVETIKGMGAEAIKAFKDVFKIASPSRVTEGMGMNLSLGLAKGIDRMSPVANDNMRTAIDMGSATAQTAVVPSRGSGGRGGATIHLHFHERSIVIEAGGGDASHMLEIITEKLPDLMADIMEDAALQAGLATGTGT